MITRQKVSSMSVRLAVITGSASGIGLALAKACMADGMHVVMLDIDKITLDEQVMLLSLSASTQIVGMHCDVANLEQVTLVVNQIIARFKRIDLLINNAGISGPLAPLWEVGAERIRHVLDVNLFGAIHCIQAFFPFMLAQNHPSHVVNMASFFGLCSGSQMAAYAMSKHAIVALSESLYFDLVRLNKPIHVSVVCPSFTNTKLLVNSESLNGSALHHRLGQLMTHGRPAEDIAKCILAEINNKNFYILPDKEVKHYCEQRSQAILNQTLPYQHNLEKIFDSLFLKYG